MIVVDGSMGEGGGQILRSSLALSLVTGKPFRMEKIRAGREKPGLLRQHLTAVNAAVEVGQAQVEGNAIGSTRLAFTPGKIKAGSYRWAVGTAGSATLVMQTVLPCLLVADNPSHLVLEGGTHNPYAPPYEFLANAFLPIINRMGPTVSSKLERCGFYPAGGGRFTIKVEPAAAMVRVDLIERGEIVRRHAVGIVAQIPRRIAENEVAVLKEKLSWDPGSFEIAVNTDSRGPGNALICTIESQNITEVFTGFGEFGIPAKQVAGTLSDSVRDYLASGVPVGRYLADQLMIPMALAGGGRFRTLPLTRHSRTNMEVIGKFLEMEIVATKQDRLVWEIEIKEKQK
jgi:RNA 3'-terminal phosphate cyclase (ATP)